MFGRLGDSSWFSGKMHQFTLAKHTLEYTDDNSCNVIGQYQVTVSHSDC